MLPGLFLLLACTDMPVGYVYDPCAGSAGAAEGDEPSRFGVTAAELAAPLSTIRVVFPEGPLGELTVESVDTARAHATWSHSDAPSCHGFTRISVIAPAEMVFTDGTRWSGSADYGVEYDDGDTEPTIWVRLDTAGAPLDSSPAFLGWFQTWVLEQGVDPVPITSAWMTIQGYHPAVHVAHASLHPVTGEAEAWEYLSDPAWTFDLEVMLDPQAFPLYR